MGNPVSFTSSRRDRLAAGPEIVDELRLRTRVAVDDLETVRRLMRVERAALEQAQPGEHRRQRRPQLVRHGHEEVARKLLALENKYDAQFRIVFDAIRELMEGPPPPEKRRIGFHPQNTKHG